MIRTARLQAGLSLEQVSAKTRIPVRNLQAIEDANLLPFSSPFFYKSFVRQFANEVNLDYELLLPLIQPTIAEIPEPVMPGQREAVMKRAVPILAKRSQRLRWLRPVSSFVMVLVVCSGLYTYWESSKARLKNVVLPAPNGQEPAASIGEMPQTVQPEDGFQVEISGIERSWLALAADGRQIFNGFLEADQIKVLRGHEVGRIRTGNAGGVSLVFNGKPIGVAGPRGQTRTVVFTKDNYQVLQPAVGAALTNDFVSLVQLLHLRRPGETPFLPLQSN
ncbi:MAG: DUF4115 domain-containing protein [Acidobacteriaceae bacterium]|nr:DUF4115 domain-containing protein [Acidobacteriaceae bacterium]